MWSDNETTQDLLGYQVHADLLKSIILTDGMLPISIGVFGNWGSGKSSLMLLIRKGINDYIEKEKNRDSRGRNSRILQVSFNSWQFESYDSTKLTLIETILDALQSDISSKRDVFEKADEFFARINYLRAGIFLLKKIYQNLISEDIKEWMPSQSELDHLTGDCEYKKLADDVSKGNSSKVVSSFRALFEKLLEDADYKSVIVYIDDLDRCEPKKIIECLEAVKLFVNVNKTAFIIGADERIIEYAIKLHYPIEQKREDISSPFSDYLEKLIQLPYKLPKLSDNEQETYITLLLCKNHLAENDFKSVYRQYADFRTRDKHSKFNIESLKSSNPEVDFRTVEEMLQIVPIMKRFLNGNPRQLKRFLNTLYVRRKLAEVAGFDEIRPDVLVKLMVLEYNTLFSSRFEDLFKMQKENGGILPIARVEEEAKTETGIQDPIWVDNWSSEYLKSWLSSAPSLKDVKLQNYFWVARDALKNERPIASLITNRIKLIYRNLKSIQVESVMRKRLPEELVHLQEDELEMLILCINEDLVVNPMSANCWRILNNDEGNVLIGDNIDRLKSLFEHVNIEKIDPQASNFFVRMKRLSNEIVTYIDGMVLDKKLRTAISRKNR